MGSEASTHQQQEPLIPQSQTASIPQDSEDAKQDTTQQNIANGPINIHGSPQNKETIESKQPQTEPSNTAQSNAPQSTASESNASQSNTPQTDTLPPDTLEIESKIEAIATTSDHEIAKQEEIKEEAKEVIKEEIKEVMKEEEIIVSNYEIEKPPMNVQQKIEEYFHTSYPINITQDVFNTKNDLIKLRRYFHANPELSFEEHETSKNILNYCESLGLATKSGVGDKSKTGVVGVLHGGNISNDTKSKCIALRADMDALPIQEENINIAYKSQKKGVMHACGHDCHMAILLTVARILSQPKYVKRINGIIKFIFQPGEEGGAGAKYMINDSNVLQADKELNCPSIDEIYGLHVWSYCKLGKIILKAGSLMAGAQSFKIVVHGIGGHGAEPLNTSDTVLAVTLLNIALHSIISRNLSACQSGVVTIGTCDVGEAHNIIADNGTITGTIRFLNNEVYAIIQQRMIEICKGVEISHNVQIEIEWGQDPYPPVINHKRNVKYVRNAVHKVFPNDENIIIQTQRTMAAEDFSFYLNQIPGCFFFVGCGMDEYCNEEDEDENDTDNNKEKRAKIYAHHTPTFKVDERCLVVGVQIFVNLVMDLLAAKAPKVTNENVDQVIEDKMIGNDNQ